MQYVGELCTGLRPSQSPSTPTPIDPSLMNSRRFTSSIGDFLPYALSEPPTWPRFRLNLPMRPMPPVALDIGGYKALRLANAVGIGTLDANNRPTANSYALHKPSLRIIIVHGIMLGRPVVPHGNGVRRPVKPELIFGNECLVK